MISKQAIEKAIEGGWNAPDVQIGFIEKHAVCLSLPIPGGARNAIVYTTAEIALDPSFWQALGKSCGWILSYEVTPEHQGEELCWCKPTVKVVEGGEIIVHADRTPHGYAHGFLDLILTNQPTDKFWEEILQTNLA